MGAVGLRRGGRGGGGSRCCEVNRGRNGSWFHPPSLGFPARWGSPTPHNCFPLGLGFPADRSPPPVPLQGLLPHRGSMRHLRPSGQHVQNGQKLERYGAPHSGAAAPSGWGAPWDPGGRIGSGGVGGVHWDGWEALGWVGWGELVGLGWGGGRDMLGWDWLGGGMRWVGGGDALGWGGRGC